METAGEGVGEGKGGGAFEKSTVFCIIFLFGVGTGVRKGHVTFRAILYVCVCVLSVASCPRPFRLATYYRYPEYSH